MTKFHNILTSYPHKDVPSALKEAQDWLRNATNAELDQFPIHRSQVRNFGILSDQEIAENRSPNHKPFASPYHWAGFCAIGL
jgi:CHAT domain-containing protein